MQSKPGEYEMIPVSDSIPVQMPNLAANAGKTASSAGKPSVTAEDATALEMAKDLAQLVEILMREQAKSTSGCTQEIEDRLKMHPANSRTGARPVARENNPGSSLCRRYESRSKSTGARPHRTP
jgi:hypothetical protein